MLDRSAVENYVNTEIVYFHEKRLARLENIQLGEVLRKKNPYLFKAKDIMTASQLVTDILDAFLYSSEEKLFGDFLESLAVFISHQTNAGKKSAAQGIDTGCLPWQDGDQGQRFLLEDRRSELSAFPVGRRRSLH